MIFTVAVLGATLAVAALPNALAVITGDIEQYRRATEVNLSPSGDSNQLKKDMESLQESIRWSLVLVIAQSMIVLALLVLAIGPLHILGFVDLLFRKLALWAAIYPAVLNAIKPLVEASKDPFDRGLAGLCTAAAFVMLYWRGWRPYRKGRQTACEGVVVLGKLKGH
ncbi:MAG: hypothetical protein LAO78_28665 [Acidobacteriia bacterium]|nr:hypothetical protein [Terriglobia bacterium]